MPAAGSSSRTLSSRHRWARAPPSAAPPRTVPSPARAATPPLRPPPRPLYPAPPPHPAPRRAPAPPHPAHHRSGAGIGRSAAGPLFRRRRLAERDRSAAASPRVCVSGSVNGSSCHGAATGLRRAGPRGSFKRGIFGGAGEGGRGANVPHSQRSGEPAAGGSSASRASRRGGGSGGGTRAWRPPPPRPVLPCCPLLRGGRPGAPSFPPLPRRGTGCRRIPPLPSRHPHESANELGPSRQQETQASVQAAPGAAAAGEEQRRRRRRGSG